MINEEAPKIQFPVGMKPRRSDSEWSVDGHETLSDQELFEYQKEIKKDSFCGSIYHHPQINRNRRVRKGQMAITPILIGLIISATTQGFYNQILGAVLLFSGIAWAVYWLTRSSSSPET